MENESNKTKRTQSGLTRQQIENMLIIRAKKMYNELQRRQSYLMSGAIGDTVGGPKKAEKIDIINALKQLTKIIEEKISDKDIEQITKKCSNVGDIEEFCQIALDMLAPSIKYAKADMEINEKRYDINAPVKFQSYTLPKVDIEEIHNLILNTNELHDLLNLKRKIKAMIGNQEYDINKKLETELLFINNKIIELTTANTKNNNNDPKGPLPSMNAEKGSTEQDIEELVEKNEYYSVLQGIPLDQAPRYRYFIVKGYQHIFENWCQRFQQTNYYKNAEMINYEDYQIVRNCYDELTNIYTQFEKYLRIEEVHDLKKLLDNLEEELQKWIKIEGMNNVQAPMQSYNVQTIEPRNR